MKKYDFSGYATKTNLKCSDGRTIKKDAFIENHGQTVPLVWQHGHDDPLNVLGHAILENREDGVYTYGIFNNTEAGKHAKNLVEHGDISALSIYANKLVQKGADVVHGAIREVSLVLTGANPGAFIDNVSIQHSDGSIDTDNTEAIIFTGGALDTQLTHSNEEEENMPNEGKTMQEVFDTMNEDQKTVVYAMLAEALSADVDEDDDDDDDEVEHSDYEGGQIMKKNVFDNSDVEDSQNTLSHAEIKQIFADAPSYGSLKESFLAHVQDYGINNIDILFPDATAISNSPTFIKRDMEWVGGVINGTHHTPFSRIKTMTADITADEARARGYVKGSLKKEEVFALLKRTTTPTTIYKKQKLDRDDLIDVTTLDVVAWMKQEMRMMLDEEIARSVLIGDGRDVASEDKINELNIRPIYKDDDMYAHKVELADTVDTEGKIEAIIRARKEYKGSGNPSLFTTEDELTDMLLLKDTLKRRLYANVSDLASALRVANIVVVPVMENVTRVVGEGAAAKTLGLVGIIVNLKDYSIGADKGGAISLFDDFDIDYNQYKYLMETRISGALTQPKSALIIEQVQAAG